MMLMIILQVVIHVCYKVGCRRVCGCPGIWLIEAETNGHHFPDDTFKCIFFNENVLISIKISLKFVPKGQTNNIPALV